MFSTLVSFSLITFDKRLMFLAVHVGFMTATTMALLTGGLLHSLTFLSIGDNEHGFSLRWTSLQAGGVIQALVAKAVLEVAPNSAPV